MGFFKKLFGFGAAAGGAAAAVKVAQKVKENNPEGVGDVNTAMALKGKTVSVYRADAALPHGAFFLQDIIGAKVVDEDGNEIGTLTDVMETPASNIYVVTGKTEHLIPAVPEFIKKTDADAGVITVHLIEGM